MTSENNTVTVLRTSPPSATRGAEQNPQILNPSGFALPQLGQPVTGQV
jgi:hypothetical protein